MTLDTLMKKALSKAKTHVIENLQIAKEKTGEINPYGDKTLMLDLQAEDEILEVIGSSSIPFAFLTEERGMIAPENSPEYLAIIDPIDGSANLERGILLVSAGISIVPFSESMTTDDVETSVIVSFFTDETYVANTGRGVTRNGKPVRVSASVEPEHSIISYDTKRPWTDGFAEASKRTLRSVHDMRRTASNLLDLCWTASGALDAMVDLRGLLPIVHVSGTHMVFEAGGFVIGENGERFTLPITPDVRMSFVAANNEELARSILSAFMG
jgi:myo-inositol-1(or 4)-monophosphatase